MKIRISKEDINFALLIFFICTTVIFFFTTYMFMSIAVDLNNVIENYKTIDGGK